MSSKASGRCETSASSATDCVSPCETQMILLKNTVLVFGPPGSGKTFVVKRALEVRELRSAPSAPVFTRENRNFLSSTSTTREPLFRNRQLTSCSTRWNTRVNFHGPWVRPSSCQGSSRCVHEDTLSPEASRSETRRKGSAATTRCQNFQRRRSRCAVCDAHRRERFSDFVYED